MPDIEHDTHPTVEACAMWSFCDATFDAAERRIGELNRLHAALELDGLEAHAAQAVTRTYGPLSNEARFWAQKGIEGMRLAVASALSPTTCASTPGVSEDA